MIRRLVVNFNDDRSRWAITPEAFTRLQDMLPPDWELVNVIAPVSSRGDGSGVSAEAIEAMRDAEVYAGFGFQRELFMAARNGANALRWAHTGTAGVASMLYPEMLESDVVLTNSAGMHGPAMAETVIGMMFYFARGFDLALTAQAESRWDQAPFETTASPVFELEGSTVGIIGLGGIGREVANRAEALGMRVLGLRRTAGDVTLEQILRESDFVVVTTPSTPKTKGLLGRTQIEQMKPSAVVINVARGDIIDESALIEALQNGRVRGAGLDVFQREPLPAESPLWQMRNVLILPHVSGTTPRFWEREIALIEENFRRYLSGETLLNVVDKRKAIEMRGHEETRKRGNLIGAVVIGALFIAVTSAHAQTAPPRRLYLGPVVPPASFQRAIAKGTRTTKGTPGPRYWENFATYRINAKIDADTKRLDGSAEITYRNYSPDTLKALHIDVTQNYHRGEAVRSEPAEVTPGMELKRVVVQGQEAQYNVQGTRMVLTLRSPLLPGQTANVTIDYGFKIPQAGIGERMGWSQDNLFFLAYWYPQMAVYDDIVGWHPDQFTGTTEFYADFANYDYTIDMPAGWVLIGTGELANAQQVLAPDVLQRLQRAEASDVVVNILTPDNRAHATTAGTNGRLQWHFVAQNVRDVAFSATRASNWDAMRTAVGDRNGDGKTDYTRVDAVWRDLAPLWKSAAKSSAHAVAFHSRNIGIPYPWSHMTAVEGADIMNGGMEYPMMTLIGPYTGEPESSLYAVLSHEEAHMWWPMIMSSDERRYSWIDEGTTQFNENESEHDLNHAPDMRFEMEDQNIYLQVARMDQDAEIMRRSAFHETPAAYEIATYEKPASVLVALRAVLGDSVFYKAYHELAQRWKYKHPYPWDIWNTFEDVSGRDLDWFWQQWYFTTWKLDQSVTSVTNTPAGSLIKVDDNGQIAMPVLLTITREGGEVIKRQIPVDTFLAGATSATVTIPGAAKVTKVEIDAAQVLPDFDRSNNIWPRQ